jgi:hypothetical protein
MSTVLDKNIQFEQVGKVMLKYHVCTLNNVRENRRAQQNGQSMDTSNIGQKTQNEDRIKNITQKAK